MVQLPLNTYKQIKDIRIRNSAACTLCHRPVSDTVWMALASIYIYSCTHAFRMSCPTHLPMTATFQTTLEQLNSKTSLHFTKTILFVLCTISRIFHQKVDTYKTSMLVNPQKAPSMSLVTPFLCSFNDFKAGSPWKVSPSIFLILLRLSSLHQ